MKHYIFLDNPIFEEPLQDFDMIIQEALVRMISRASEEGTVTLKLDIKRSEKTGGIAIKHNANYNIPLKDKFEGETVPGQFKLAVTPEGVAIQPAMDQMRIGEE